VGERLAEGLYILQEVLDRFRERQLFFIVSAAEFKPRLFGFEFQALPLLRLRASAGVSPAASRRRRPFALHSIR
jgi:hypothetical protein